jgi:hypothetical protein
MRLVLYLLALLCFSWPAHSTEYYKWYDKDGNVHISDKKPPASAQEVESFRYQKNESYPAFQRYSHPEPSTQYSQPPQHQQQEVRIDPVSIRIEEERLLDQIRRHEQLRDRSSNELGISKYRSGTYTNDKLRENRDRHQAEIDKYRRMLIELKRDPYYYFRKHGYVYYRN